MRRYIRSRRSRSNYVDTSALRDQFIRDFTQQAQSVMQDLTMQFSQTLQNQAAQAFQGIVPNGNGAVPMPGNEPGSIGAIGQLLSTGVRYLVSRPRTSRSEQETSRSVDAAQFRVSTAQAAAEAQQTLGKGSKNL